MLNVEESGTGPPLALIHGFTQSARAWGRAGDALALRYRLLAIDAPGHGGSAGVEADLPAGADMMAAQVGELVGPAAWLGYSMGGRYALHVALSHPDVVDKLILVSATAGIDDPGAREERLRADEALADRAEQEGLERFVRWWLSQPLFATLPPEAAVVEGRLGGTGAGLATSLRLAGTGTQAPLWEQLPGLDMPVLVVAGGLDTKYTELARRLASTIGDNATLRIIHDAGHACHLERPDEFVDVVGAWL